jgi:hypothetical protein
MPQEFHKSPKKVGPGIEAKCDKVADTVAGFGSFVRAAACIDYLTNWMNRQSHCRYYLARRLLAS